MAKNTTADKTIPQLIGGTDKHAIIEYFRNLERKQQTPGVSGGTEVHTVNNYPTTINHPCNGAHASAMPAMVQYIRLTDWLLMVVIVLLFVLIIKQS